MLPRISLATTSRSIVFRSRVPAERWRAERCAQLPPSLHRTYTSGKDESKNDEQPLASTETDTMPHISQESSDMSKTMGEQGPDLSQGTPVEEVLVPHIHQAVGR